MGATSSNSTGKNVADGLLGGGSGLFGGLGSTLGGATGAAATNGGKNQHQQGSPVQHQQTGVGNMGAGGQQMPPTNSWMNGSQMGFQNMGSQGGGFGQGFNGGQGQMQNPNFGGLTGFGNSSMGTLTGGPATQPGGNMASSPNGGIRIEQPIRRIQSM